MKCNKLIIIVLFLIVAGCQKQNDVNENVQFEDTRPNILLIVADDHGTDDMGCYGNTAILTPNLDKLASEGVRFDNAYCTSASCSASRSVILSGVYNHANGQYGHQHSIHHFSSFSNLKTLPVILSENGYKTARIGKYHVSPEQVYRFDVVLNGGGRNNIAMADSTMKFIHNTNNVPFFLYVGFNDPHRSTEVNDSNQYKPNRFGNSEEGYPGVEKNRQLPEEVIVPYYLPNNPAARAELVEYYESVNRLDQGVGRILDHLKDAEVYDKTIIIYVSDNGIAFPGAKTNVYNPGIKLPLIVRNPFISRVNPSTKAMVNWADLTPTILDFAGILPSDGNLLQQYLTIKEKNRLDEKLQQKEIKGVPVFSKFHGRSFKPVLESGDISGWDESYASHTFHEITMYYPMRVAMNRKYKLIWNIASDLAYPIASDLYKSATWQSVIDSEQSIKMYGPRSIESYIHRPKFELFDVEIDPMETNNLAENPDYRFVLQEMKGKLKDFQYRTQDPWIVKWEYE